MAPSKLGGIRLRIVLITVVVTFMAMAGVVALSAYASQEAMREIISRSLVERLDTAQLAVEQGDIQQAIDDSGIELLQVIGPDGKVIASTPNAQGLKPIDVDDDLFEVDDFEFDEDDFDDADDSDDDARDGSQRKGQVSASDRDDDADDDDDDDDDADADDADADDADDDADADADDDADDADDNAGEDADDDAYDDDDDKPAVVAAAPKRQETSDDSDDDNDDADDDDDRDAKGGGDKDDDDDDDDGDDDDKHAAKHAKKMIAFNPFMLQKAFAAESKDLHSIEASSVLGTPGPFLVVRRTVDSPDGGMTLVAMTSLHPALETATRTAEQVGMLMLVLLVLAAFFAWEMTGRTLRPVDTMRREVEAISERNLSERITPPENDRDLSALAHTFNGLLARIEASVDEQKRFVSDASHELKSPIAATNLMLETLREHPETVERDVVLADLTAENGRLAQIVDDLLVLARQDEGRLTVDLAPIDFYDVLFEETASLQQRFEVKVDLSGVEPIIGRTDANLLSHAVRNLLDNAARYAHDLVAVSCRENGGMVQIRISDDGMGIPPEDRERVFGRFVRLEEGRDRKKGSTGLGLSVARGNIERLGGRVYFGDSELGGATAIIELPIE